MTTIGIDTSVLVALLDARDKWHKAALELKRSLQLHQAQVAIFDCVLAETISTIARRMNEQRRSEEFTQVVTRLTLDYPLDSIAWVLPDVPLFYSEILGLIGDSGGELNFNDALIALACRDRGIGHLASYDGDFDGISWLRRVTNARDIESLSDSS